MSEHCEEMERPGGKSESCRRFQQARVVVERMLQERLSSKGVHRSGRAFSNKHCRSSRQAGDLQKCTAKNGTQPVEGANEFLLLLKSHKETLEEEMKELRRKKEAFEKEKDKEEKERVLMRRCIDQLLLQAKGGDLSSRLEAAERTLALRQDQIDQLRNELERQKGSLENVSVLAVQVKIYRADLLAEREAQAKLSREKEELQEQLNQALAEIDRLKQEATSHAQMQQMMWRHLKGFRTQAPYIPLQQGVYPSTAFSTMPPAPLFHNHTLEPLGDLEAAGTEVPV